MSVVGVLLIAAIAFLWLGVLANASNPNSSDAAGNGMSEAFGAIFAITLWILLAILLMVAGINGEMPSWTAAVAFILVPASGVAAVVAGDLIVKLDKMGAGGRWLIVVPALVPPLLVFFALWSYLPSLRAMIPANLAGGLVWGMVLMFSILPWPMMAKKNQLQQSMMEATRIEAAKNQAKFDKLTPESPLWDWLPFIDSYLFHSQVIDHIRHSKTMQADAEAMLDRDDFPLLHLRELEAGPTPEFCQKLRAFLERKEASMRLATPQSKPYKPIAGDVDAAINAMSWLNQNHHDVRDLGGGVPYVSPVL
jgi:hypothetical protein